MSQNTKVWLITGCSTGFGREIADAAINAGYNVVVTARHKDTLSNLGKGCEENVLRVELDVTKPEQIATAVKQTVEKFGKIDVLVNNAGIGYFSSVEESVEEETRKMFEINFWGLMNMTNAVLPYMRNQRSGHIINFSSVGGLVSFPSLGYYHATKYAVEGISESLSQELVPFHISVTLIEPSGFRTDWSGRSSLKTESQIEEYTKFLAPMFENLGKGQEPGDPKKAAAAIISLVEAENPPLRLLLGNMAYHAAKRKLTNMLDNIEVWKDVTLKADFDE